MIDISVVIPAYNAELTIANILEDVLGIKNVEILVIDDGSTDQTKEVIEGLAEQYSNIRLILGTHSGASASRNIGIEQANGTKIMFVDADDRINAEVVNACLQENPQADMIAFPMNQTFNQEEPTTIAVAKEERVGLMRNALQLCNQFQKQFQISAAPYSKIYETSFLHKNGLRFNEQLVIAEDMLFITTAMSHIASLRIETAGFYQYEMNENSVTHKMDLDIVKNAELFLADLSRIVDQETIQGKSADALVRDSVRLIKQKDVSNQELQKYDGYLKHTYGYAPNLLSIKRQVLFYLLKMKWYWIVRKLV
ncbi:glycosyltransferase [Weissella viridescens]|uniref:glycosyltransferase family 2 protein n=1 Tax=Weissella viridescens TaxID=1629 RepID=UPI001747AC07|nr:glycosyltransferase family 2 protein [Weissella viridescens]QOD85855.1 glycosyltransferase [Weissella viridescens]WJI90973.1 glycosyltransferase [Weissella viridescens]